VDDVASLIGGFKVALSWYNLALMMVGILLVEAGANAVIAFRFDTSELGTTWTEICAYGTAVRAAKR